MSLPSSERLPNDINELPPARQRHIRRQPRSASFAERQILLESLVRMTAPTPAFFLRALLGALAIGAAFYLQDLAVLIIAIVALPFQTPLFGLALYPVTLNFKHALKSLVSFLILLILTIAAGALAGLFLGVHHPDPLGIYRFTALYWLDLTLLGVSAFLSVLILLRQGKIPLGMGVLLSYTLLVPCAVFGYGLGNGHLQLWLGALLVSFAHLGLVLVIAGLSFLILGFPPKKAMGWLLLVVVLLITLAAASASLNISISQKPNQQPMIPSPTRLMVASPTLSPTAVSTHTPVATSTSITPTTTWTPSPSPEPTPTLTPEPIAYWGLIDADIGAVIRENPSFDSEIVGYTNDGDTIEILGEITPQGGSLWFQVQTESGNTGWLLGSLVQTLTPTPTQTQ